MRTLTYKKVGGERMDGGTDLNLATANEATRHQIPEYLVKTYSWAYLTPASLVVFDNPLVTSGILWGNMLRLVRTACGEFEPGQRIMQAANAYGNLSVELARTVGPEGRLDVIDVAPLQVQHCRKKLAGFPQARVRLADAASPGGGIYDGVCCFFLLHEIPDDHKLAVVDALLASVPPGGKVVFVDYHKTVRAHPLRPVMHLVFRWLEPFASSLVDSEIADLASDRDSFRWRKETFFGDLYQKVVAVRRIGGLAMREAAE